MHVLNNTELYTLNGSTVYYMIYILIKLFQKSLQYKKLKIITLKMARVHYNQLNLPFILNGHTNEIKFIYCHTITVLY